MPRNPQPLGTPGQSGQAPRIEHDPLWLSDLRVWERMDTHANGFVRPAYGDPYAGYVDPGSQATLYASYTCVAITVLDNRYIDVCYRLLPSGMLYSWGSYSDLPFPDILTGIDVAFNTNFGSGTSTHPVSQQGALFVNGGSVSVNPRGRAQASAAILPELTPIISQPPSRRVPTMNYVFYMPNGAASIADVLTYLTTLLSAAVSAFPLFETGFYTISAFGQTVSVSADAESYAALSANAANTSGAWSFDWGNGSSQEVGASTKTIRIGPVINPAITLSPSSATRTATATVTADTIALELDSTVVVAAITNEPTPTTITATGSISPTSIAATAQTDIPRSGLILTELTQRNVDDQLILAHAEIVDASIFA